MSQLGRLRECIAPLEQAMTLRPKVAEVQYDLGRIYLQIGQTHRALDYLQKAATLKASDANIQFHLGLAMERNGQLIPAIKALRRATKLTPKHIEAYLKLAQLLLATGNRNAAIATYKRAAGRSPKSELGQLCRAHAFIEAERTEDAIESLTKTVDIFPNSGVALGLLGRLMVEIGRFDTAETHFLNAIDIDPRQAHFYYEVARGRKMSEADRALLKRMQAALAMPELSDSSRYSINLALGKAADDCGQPGEAMQYWREANRWKSRISPFVPEELQRRLAPLFSLFTESTFSKFPDSRSNSEAPILIIGLPRSGTTLVDQILSSHPEVGAAGELGYWHQVGQTLLLNDGRLDAELLQTASEDYLQLLNTVSPKTRRVTDKMPQNFIWAGLIHLAFPNARFIHCQRSPLDNCLSIFSTFFGPKPDFSTDPEDLAAYHQEYLRLMKHWYSVIDTGRLMDVRYEELVSNPEPVIRKMLDFCDLAWDPACLQPHQNTRTVRTASSWQVRQPINSGSVGRWKRYEPWLEDLALLFPPDPDNANSDKPALPSKGANPDDPLN